MKKTYETMEAYKVSFNANEQIAAAACKSYEINGRFGNEFNPTCEADIVGGKYVIKAQPTFDTSKSEYWGTPGGANDGVRYA